MQNFSSISPKLCLLSQKYTGTWGVNTTIGEYHFQAMTDGGILKFENAFSIKCSTSSKQLIPDK